MKKLRIGVLGVSNHFIKRILLPVKQLDNCVIKAIASREEDKAKQAAKMYDIPLVFKSYADLLASADVDAIYIPLPNHMHAEWIRKAIESGKPVLCEKPLCMDAEEAIEVAEYAKSKGVKLMEAFMYKFHPMWIHAKNIVDTNQIGEVSYVHMAFSYTNTSPTNIRNIKDYGGGSLMDIGCYAVSIPRFILNEEPRRVVGLVNRHPTFKTDTLSSAMLDFGRARALFTVGTLSETHQIVDIIGTAGSITIPMPLNTFVDVKSCMTITGNLGSRQVEYDPADQYGLMFKAFADSILNDEPVPNSIDDAIHNQKALDAIFRSELTGSWEEVK